MPSSTAVGTGGTTTTVKLSSLPFIVTNDISGSPPLGTSQLSADVGTINNLILDDKQYIFPAFTGQPNTQVIVPAAPVGQSVAGLLSGGLSISGLLTIPNRGTLRVLPGDYVMVDLVTGWPILVSRTAILAPGSSFAHTT